jgi:phospholipid/cholesterol/gamma-HCH transport system ATP-binding protein
MIKITDLYKNFGTHRVLDGVNLEIKEGEVIVIIGRSGEGKSVLLKHIVGLLQPDKGSVEIDGQDITKMDSNELAGVQKRFGMLFQGAALFDSLTVAENVSFGLRYNPNLSEGQIRDIVKEKLSMVGLSGIEHLKPSDLSGGMRKRVGLARAIAANPDFILYDEPTTGIDPIMGDIINDLIIDLKSKLKITSIAVTHDMVSAYKIANRIAMLYEGKIIEVGGPNEIKNTANPVVRQFITGSGKGPIKV